MFFASKSRSSTVHSRKSVGLRKVTLKATSGMPTPRYKDRSTVKTDKPSGSRTDKVFTSPEASKICSATFESLPELFESQERYFMCGDDDGNSRDLPALPDFPSYNFWASVSELDLSSAVNLSDTFSRHKNIDVGMMDQAQELSPDVLDLPVLGLDNFPAVQPDPRCQYSVNFSDFDEAQITNRKCYWDFPLELAEDIFESTINCPKRCRAGNDDSNSDRESVDKYLVDNDRSPQFCRTNAEILDSNLLVYVPNRYVEDACIFQSSKPAHLTVKKSYVPAIRIPDGIRFRSPLATDLTRSRTKVLKQNWLEDGPSNLDPSVMIGPSRVPVSDVDEHIAAEKPCEVHDKAASFQDYYVHRRRRLSTPGMKRSKLPKLTPTSFEARGRPLVSRENTPGTRSPVRKADSETARRTFESGYCSDSPLIQSDHSFQKDPVATVRQFSVIGEKKSPVFQGSKNSFRASAPPLRDLPNQGSGTMDTTNRLSGGPSLRRRKRTAHVRDRPSISEIKTWIDIKRRSSQINKLTPNSPRDNPVTSTKLRKPRDSPKKFRRSPRRPPISAKKLRFHFKVNEGGASPLEQHSPVAQAARQLTMTKRPRLPRLPQKSVEILQRWLNENLPFPYPSREEKNDLVSQSCLKMSQIENWLSNARQKLKVNMSKCSTIKDLSESSSSAEEPRKRSKRKSSYSLN